MGLGLAAVVVTGCGSSTGGPAAVAAAPAPAPTTASQSPPRDVRACAGAGAIVGHIAADTVHWQPTQHPFDQDIAHRIALRAGELARQAPQASTAPVRQSIHDSAVAFDDVARAIMSRKRTGVDRSIQRVRTTYSQLKQLCSLGS